MTAPEQIDQALQRLLPEERQAERAALARLLGEILRGALKPEAASAQIAADPALQAALRGLAGQQISTTDATVAFGEDNQFGDVTIDEVAGGNITKLTLNYYEAPDPPAPPPAPPPASPAPLIAIDPAGGLLIAPKLWHQGALLVGGALLLVSLALSAANAQQPTAWLAPALNVVPLGIALLGLYRERRAAAPRALEPQPAPGRRPKQTLKPGMANGLYGGLIGGVTAGLLMVAAYAGAAPVGRLAEIFIFAALAGIVFGAATQLAVLWGRRIARRRPRLAPLANDMAGGLIGGVLAGCLMGALGGWFFGLDRTPRPALPLFAVAIVLGPTCLSIASLFYDYRGSLRKVGNALITSLGVTFFALLLGIGLARLGGFVGFFMGYFTDPSLGRIVQGATMFGAFLGAVVGLQVGMIYKIYLALDRAG